MESLSLTLIIIIITSLISISAFSNSRMMEDLIFYPPAISRRNQWYRFFSCGLIHADWAHLIFNMLSLYLFGENVEKAFVKIFGQKGKLFYLLLYVLALFFSLLPTFFRHKDSYHYRSLGASGAVSAVVFTGILFFPVGTIGIFFLPIEIAGFIFGILYLALTAWMDRRGADNINHSAHLFGALFGIGFTIVLCNSFSNYPVVVKFIDAIKSADPTDFIRLGTSTY
ncbi:MAG: rhomboid family intramembrane serine protease [Bacteroidetes bacterium]|nr:rhomboid family intramembrane serine protease [Bacteroidota bacterium]